MDLLMEAKITEDANTQVHVSYFNPLDQLELKQ